jgi:hypothetical protein
MRVTADRINAEPRAVIQLDPVHCSWGPLLCIVESVHSWGVVCYALVAERRGEPPAQMFIRVKHEHYVVLGVAEWVMGFEPDAPESAEHDPT